MWRKGGNKDMERECVFAGMRISEKIWGFLVIKEMKGRHWTWDAG